MLVIAYTKDLRIYRVNTFDKLQFPAQEEHIPDDISSNNSRPSINRPGPLNEIFKIIASLE